MNIIRKKMPLISNYKSIAILQTAFLGDVALTLPLCHAIKKHAPESRLTFITNPAAAAIAGICSDIDNVIIYDKRNKHSGYKGIKHISGILNNNNTDLIITPHRSLRSSLITLKVKKALKAGFNKNSMSWPVYDKRIKYKPFLHEINRNLSLLSIFDDVNDEKIYLENVPLRFSPDDIKTSEKILSDIIGKSPFCLIAPGSVWPTKRWIPDKFARLCELINSEGINPVLTGGSSDTELCDYIAHRSGAVSISGTSTLPQSVYIMSKALFTVTNDSAPTHLAGLAGCPVLTIYGPTSPVFGFYPVNFNDRIVYNHNLKCSPCKIHGSRQCPLGTHECMHSIEAEHVMEKIKNILRPAC
ncbi:MAG: glycosyltransferase family 9 protein [Candidatus Kapaibacterium sp.]